jgi:light-regulated signal transduction histidine kinase (bacteriophytochrome)
VADRTVELAAANKELESFCYSVSHDLRAPLRSIDGFSKAVQEDYHSQLDADGADFLQRIRSAAKRMGELIDDLLELSRVSRADLHNEQVNLSELAESIIQELRQAEPGRSPDIAVGKDMITTGDRGLLKVVLSNLLGNAWKYTSKTENARIEFGCVNRDGIVVYFVRDNGAGFDSTYAHKLFEPFQRLHRESDFPGHGIGLATVRRIVWRHSGQVAAFGKVGHGSVFWFTLQKHKAGLFDECQL